MFDEQLVYYKGNYDNFEKVKNEKDTLQRRQKESQDKKIEHVQKFIDKFRANAKRASMVQSRIKMVAKMDVVEDVIEDPTIIFNFPNPEKMQSPMMKLDEAIIGYSSAKIILDKVNI